MPSKPSQSAQPLLLAITLVSTVLAAFLLSRQPVAQAETSIANDRPDRPDRSDEIVVIPVAIKMGMEGIALVDKGHQTICIYQYQPHLPAHQRFSLLA
ncbi:MAG: hypothetical protein K9M57_10975, partial [Phycisphaerae bacterium]|nr:hypothetical protein [Phycisphaerae bacterium]